MPRKRHGRRANGEGSVFQFHKGQKKGKWAAKLLLPNGKRVQVEGKTQDDVLLKLHNLRTEADQGPIAENTNQPGSFSELLDSCLATVNVSTVDTYKLIAERHIKPALGEIQVRDLNFVTVQNFITGMDKTYSPSYVHQAKCVLSRAFKFAKKAKRMSVNLTDELELNPIPRRSERSSAYTKEQANKLREALRGNPWECLFVTLPYSGLRRGEGLGLRWSEVDLEQGSILVKRSLRYTPGHGKFVKSTKTNRERTVPIPSFVVELLKAHKAKQVRSLDPRYGDLVFVSETGGPLSPSFVSKVFRRLLKRLELPPIRLHDLRHTFGTLMRQAKTDVKVLQTLMGHADSRTTMDVYGHVAAEELFEARDRLEAFVS